VANNPRVRSALRSILENDGRIEVVGEANGSSNALRQIKVKRPDVAVMNCCMPGMCGFETAARMQRKFANVQFVVLHPDLEATSVKHTVGTQGVGFLIKDVVDRLSIVIREVATGRRCFSPALLQNPARSVGHARRRKGARVRLTPRQREVVHLIAEGFSTKQIADRLGISVKTAQTHRTELMKRLDLHDVASVVRYAIRIGLVPED